MKSLSVPFPLFGDRAAEMHDIALLTQLQSLDFQDGSFGSDMALSDSEMEKLSSITELRSLSLISLDNSVTDISLLRLSKLKKLRSLSLPRLAPRITAEGIQRLQSAIPDCWITR